MCQQNTESGGLLGFAEALLKENDQAEEFDTHEEAERRAQEVSKSMNSGHSSATFTYWPVKL